MSRKRGMSRLDFEFRFAEYAAEMFDVTAIFALRDALDSLLETTGFSDIELHPEHIMGDELTHDICAAVLRKFHPPRRTVYVSLSD